MLWYNAVPYIICFAISQCFSLMCFDFCLVLQVLDNFYRFFVPQLTLLLKVVKEATHGGSAFCCTSLWSREVQCFKFKGALEQEQAHMHLLKNYIPKKIHIWVMKLPRGCSKIFWSSLKLPWLPILPSVINLNGISFLIPPFLDVEWKHGKPENCKPSVRW